MQFPRYFKFMTSGRGTEEKVLCVNHCTSMPIFFLTLNKQRKAKGIIALGWVNGNNQKDNSFLPLPQN